MKSRAIGPVLVVAAVVATGLWLQGATPSVPTGQWQAGAALGQPRTGAVPVMLDDGRVLLIGGRAAGAPVAAVDVVNPDGSITAGIPLSLPRAGHTAVRLADGSVLVAGGTTLVAGDQGTVEAATATAEVLYAGATQWIAATGLTQARTSATATSLPDGRVLVAGGADDSGPLDTFEIYDPVSTTFHPGGLLSAARAGHAAAVAGKTSVLVAGGHNASGAVGTADIIDADTGGVVTVTMTAARDGASATALLDGRVLVAGGWDGTDDLASAEVIDPVAATTTATLPMGSPRRDHQALLLEHNATVLVTGGTNGGAVVPTAEHFVAWENGFRPAVTNPAVSRSGALTSALPSEGVALLAAGQGADSSLVAPTELYGFATLHTDKDDYAPGTFVTITGSGWQPGETVHLVLRETGPNPDPDVPLTAVADVNGSILNDVWAPDDHDIGMRFYLTATGSASTAQLTFTDNTKLQNVTVTAQNPSPASPGNSVQFTVTVNYNGNGSCTAGLSASSLPTGVTFTSFVPLNLTGTSSGSAPTSTLTLQTSNTTPPGSLNFTVTAQGTGGAGNDCATTDSVQTTGNLIVVEPTTTTLTAAPNPSVFGQSVTLTATVTQTVGSTIPTGGSVTFKDGAATLGTSALVAGSATFSTPALSVSGSPHGLTASYAGVANTFGASNSTTVSQVVNQASTSTGVASSANPSVFGQSVTFTATVIPVAPGAGARTGTVTFKDGATTLGTGTLNGAGLATFSSSSLGIGSHSITAVYAGDANFSGSTSSAFPQTVNQASTTTSVARTSGPNPSTFGQSLTFTATVAAVAPGAGTPTGTVTFKDGAATLGTSALNGSAQASLTTTTLAPGSHSITAVYNADTNFTTSTSSALAQTVSQAATTTTITSDSPDPSQVGDPVTVNYAVAVTGPGAGTPTGNVIVSGGGGDSCVGTVAAGTCTITFTSLGNKTLTATYAGDTNFTGSTSAGVSHLVGQPPAITSTNSTTFTVGSAGSFTVTATGSPAPTFTETGALPSGVTLSSSGVLSGTPALGTVGNYPITITASNGVGTGATQNFTLTVGKGTVSFAILAASQTIAYGTLSIAVSGRIDGAQMLPGTVTVSVSGVSTGPLGLTGNPNNFNGTLNTSAIPATAVPYTITYTYPGDANYNSATDTSTTLTVNKATPTVTVSFPASPIPYDGLPHAASVTVTGVGGATLAVPGDGTTSVTYLKAGLPSGVPTDAGGYTASATFTSSNPNYNNASSSAPAALTINKATPTVTVSFPASPIPYDGSPHPATVTVTGLSGPLGPADGTTLITYLKSGSPSGAPTDAGSYTASATFTATNSNYNNASSVAPAALTIEKATPTVTVSFPATPIPYDGSPHPAGVTVNGVSGPLGAADGTTLITYLKSGAPSGVPTDAGSYTASATFTATNPNYNNANSVSPAALTIEKATPTVTVSFPATPIPYDGSPHPAGVTVNGVSGPLGAADGTTLITYLKSGAPSGVPTDAGSYTASATFTATNPNYNDASSTTDAALVINKADPIVSATGNTCTYNGSGCAATASAKGVLDEVLAVNIAYSATLGPGNVLGSQSPTAPVNAGTYYAAARYPGDANYNPKQSAPVTILINKASTTAIITNAASLLSTPTVVGEGYVVQWSVSVVAPGAGTPTGNLTVSGGSTCAAAVSADQCTVTSTTAGTKSLVAAYEGDNNFEGSSSDPAAHTVNLRNTSAVLALTSPVVVGQASTVTVTVTDTEAAVPKFFPTGTIGLITGEPSDVISACTLANTATPGVSTCSTTITPAHVATSPRTVTASFTATSVHKTSQDTRSLTVNPASTDVTITNAAALLSTATVVGESYTVQWSVGVVAPGAGTPTGNVTVSGGSGCTAAASVGQCSVTSTTAGLKSLVATYDGNSDYTGSASTAAAHTVNPANTATTITSHVPSLSVVGQLVTVSFNVGVSAPGAGSPTGNVTVSDGTQSCTGSVTAGSCGITFTTAAIHSLTATYAGDSNFNGSATPASTPHTVNQASTTLTITNAAALASTPTTVGESYTVAWSVAPVAPGSGTPTGTVTVTGGSSCTAAVSALQCTLTSTTPGAKTLVVTYGGDPNFVGSTASVGHNVQYGFTGFFAPVDNAPVVNKANAGQAIPVKWRLVDFNGAGVSDPSNFVSLTVYPVGCGAWTTLPSDPLPDQQASTSGLLYQGNGNWQYNWKTPKQYANSCMVARVTLFDGSTHDFDVSFK